MILAPFCIIFHFEYMGQDKQYHRYFPDFVVKKKTGEFYIVEVKSESEREDETVEAKKKAIGAAETKPVADWIKNSRC